MRAWDPGPNRSTALLAGGLLLLFITVAGRFASPRVWRRSGERPQVEPPRVHAWRTKGGSLHVEEYGPRNAPAMVLVHGVGSDRTQWLEAVEELSLAFRVYVFDLPGHGRSERTRSDLYTIESAALALDEVVRRAGEDGLVLVGHSMGGMIAMRWCEAHRARAKRIGGLVLVHTTPQNPFTTMRPIALHRALVPAYDAWLRLVPAIWPLMSVMQWLEYLNGSLHWQNDRELFAGTETREQLERTARVATSVHPMAHAAFTRSMIRFDARPQLPRLEVPTLVIAGDRDRTTIPEASQRIAGLVPDARLVTLPKARHLGLAERRHEFAEALVHFAGEAGAERSTRAAK